MNARSVVGIAVVFAVAATGVVLCWKFASDGGVGGDPRKGALPSMRQPVTNETSSAGLARADDDMTAAVKAAKAAKRKAWFERLAKYDPYEGFTAEERALCEALQAATDEDDFERVLKIAEEVLKSKNPAVRENVVEALSWFGEKALPELTPLMGDKDEDVAKAAMSAWESALSEIENARARLETAGLALKTISDKDALTTIGAQYSCAAQEWIDSTDDEEKAMERRVSVIQTLVDVLEGDAGLTRLEAAKEVYEDVTGHEWRSIDEAEIYLKDPDNYELPEDRESAEASKISEGESDSVHEDTMQGGVSSEDQKSHGKNPASETE